MLRPTPPMSNIERQRRFRERHPGYYGRYHANYRARIKANVVAIAMATETMGETVQPLALPPMVVRLALPAPVETIVIPGMNTIGQMPVPIVVPIRRQAA